MVRGPGSSGYAMMRAWFPSTDMIADPRTREFCEEGDTFNAWMGPDVQFMFSTVKGGTECCWELIHRDEHNTQNLKSSPSPGKLDEVYKVLKGWDPVCRAIVEKTPQANLVAWKLVNRNPLSTWLSKHGRILLLGDAAHPFSPASTDGATQAMEDGVTIAVCLKRAGKGNVPAAAKTNQELRHIRVRKVQKTEESARHLWHKTNWSKLAAKPGTLVLPRVEWILQHDAEKHAEEVYETAFRKVTARPGLFDKLATLGVGLAPLAGLS